MLKDLIYLVSFYLTDKARLILKLYSHNIYFEFINNFKVCCINNEIISIKILSLTNNKLNWDRGLRYACEGGHRDLVDLIISLGADYCGWHEGLWGACEGGYRDIVSLMIEHGANNWNGGLVSACEGGHRDIVDFMIENGANDWNR